MHVGQTGTHVASKDWCRRLSDFQRSTTSCLIQTHFAATEARQKQFYSNVQTLDVWRQVSRGSSVAAICCTLSAGCVTISRVSHPRGLPSVWTSVWWSDIGCQIGGLNLSWDQGFRQPELAVQSNSVFRFSGEGGPVSWETLVSTKCRVFFAVLRVSVS